MHPPRYDNHTAGCLGAGIDPDVLRRQQEEGLKAAFAKQASNRISDAPTSGDFGTVKNVFQQMDSNMQFAQSLLSRLRAANDFINGARPEGDSTQAGQRYGNGAIETMSVLQDEHYRTLDAIDNEVRRLERVVG